VIDLHCHLLPGVDDGPETIDESLDYALAASRAGTDRIVATPHIERVEVTELPLRVHELQSALDEAGIELQVDCGGELKPHSIPSLSDGELDTIAHGPPGRRWVLLEVPFRGLGQDLLDAADELRGRGFAPLLAHPERATRFRDSIPALREQVDRGAGVQMNVGPLTGEESRERHEAALRLLRTGLPSALATDAHPPNRPYTLAQGRALAIQGGASEADATRLIDDTPHALLTNGLSFQPSARGYPGPTKWSGTS
jgi:protein-tyrosine phosphatase